MNSEENTSEEKKPDSVVAPKFGNQLRFVNIFLLAVLALFIPVTVLMSQSTQDVRQHAQQANPNGFTVEILDTGFNPPSVTIQPGQTITWVNHGTVPHSTASDTQGTPDSWDSRGLQTAQTFSQNFINPGTFAYHDNLNPGLRATIIVTQGGIGATDTPTPIQVPSPNCLGSCPTSTPQPTGPTPTSTAQTPTPTPFVTVDPTIQAGMTPTPTIFGGQPTDTPTVMPSGLILPTTGPTGTIAATATPTPQDDGQNNKGIIGFLLAFILLLLELFSRLIGQR